MCRRLRTKLPATSFHLTPELQSHESVREALGQQQRRQENAYNKKALFQSLSQLRPGETVRVQVERGGIWSPATVISEAGLRSYRVHIEDGVLTDGTE